MTPSGIALSCLTLISIEPLLVVTFILSPAFILFLIISLGDIETEGSGSIASKFDDFSHSSGMPML